MKFVAFYIACCVVALAAAKGEPSQEEFKNQLDDFIQMTEMNCDNHEAKCDDHVVKVTPKSQDLRKAVKEFCITVMKQYLCDGKKEGDQFADLYRQSIKMVEEIQKLDY